MGRAEYEAMVTTGRVQPTVTGLDMKHVTAPPDPEAFWPRRPAAFLWSLTW